jgi:hypothetical protein
MLKAQQGDGTIYDLNEHFFILRFSFTLFQFNMNFFI